MAMAGNGQQWPMHALAPPAAKRHAWCACRMMPDSNGGASSGHSSVALLFGLVGLLNMVCLAPLLLILMWAAVIDASQVTAGMLGLNVLKGEPCPAWRSQTHRHLIAFRAGLRVDSGLYPEPGTYWDSQISVWSRWMVAATLEL